MGGESDRKAREMNGSMAERDFFKGKCQVSANGKQVNDQKLKMQITFRKKI